VLENKINKIGLAKVKILLIERFSGEKIEVKVFLIQIKLKLRYKGMKVFIVVDQIAYIGLFLIDKYLNSLNLM